MIKRLYFGVSRLNNTNRTPIYDESYYAGSICGFEFGVPKWLYDELYE